MHPTRPGSGVIPGTPPRPTTGLPRPLSSRCPKPPQRGRRHLHTNAEVSFYIVPPDIDPKTTGGAHLLKANYTNFAHQFEADLKTFSSGAVACELSLEKILQETSELPRPNLLRTAGCAMILVKLCQTFACQKSVMRRLLDEVLAAIYQGYSEGMQDDLEHVVALRTFSDLLIASHIRNDKVEMQLRAAEASQDRQVIAMDRVMNTWQGMLRQRIFVGWRNYFRREKARAPYMERMVAAKAKWRAMRVAMGGWRRVTRVDKEEREKEYGSKEVVALRAGMLKMQADVARLSGELKNAVSERNVLIGRNVELTAKWDKECGLRVGWQAMGLCALGDVWTVEQQSPEEALCTYSEEGSSTLRVDAFRDVSSVAADRMCLLWVRNVLVQCGSQTKLPTNLTEDFRNGDVFVALVNHVMGGEVGVELPVTDRCFFFLTQLEKFIGHAVPFTATALSSGNLHSVACCLGYLIKTHTTRLASPEGLGDDPIVARAHYDRLHRDGIVWRRIADHVVQTFTRKLILREDDPSELKQYSAYDVKRLDDIFPGLGLDTHPAGQTQLAHDISEKVKQHAVELRRVFKFYCSGGSMGSTTYWKFLTDCKLLSKPRILSKTIAGKIFASVDQAGHQASSPLLDAEGEVLSPRSANILRENANPVGELCPIEFVDVLVHVAYYLGDKAMPLHARLEEIISGYVLKYAATSSADEFRSLVGTKSVQNVIATHNVVLMKIFRQYTKPDPAAENTLEMSRDDFLMLLKDFNMYDTQLTTETAKELFHYMQDDSTVGAYTDNVSHQFELLTYREFVDTVVATSVFKVPQPWLPMSDRLNLFIKNVLIPASASPVLVKKKMSVQK